MRAVVLRLLRADAQVWWYHRALREQGRFDEARRLERRSIRQAVESIRSGVGRRMETYRIDTIVFPDPVRPRPFDLTPNLGFTSYTTSHSGCHPGFFAAFVYCYAHRIGLKFTAKESDLV